MISGSQALRYHGIDLGPVNDLDVIVYKESQLNNYNNPDYFILPKKIYDSLYNKTGYIYPEDILTIKMSHLSWDIKWEKTLRHINLLVNMGYSHNPELYKLLKAHWEQVHGNKDFLSLGADKDEFFNDFVTYEYDHDYLHELVAYPERPVYEMCLKENEEVLIDKTKFLNLDFNTQVKMFREEITVIAIERWLVNPTNKGKISWYSAYLLSLKKTITRLTKNWASDFIIHNIRHFRKPEYKYFKNTINKLNIEGNNMTTINEIQEFLNEIGANEEKDQAVFCLAYDVSYLACAVDRYEDRECSWDEASNTVKSALKKFQYEHIERDGGGEGGSEYCRGVFKLNGKFYSVEFSYYSHDGFNYDGITETLKEVTPVKKIVTFYE